MEDSHIANTRLPDGVSLFGVFDGHGGKHISLLINALFVSSGQEVALYVKKYYTKILTNLQSYKGKNYRLALEESFMKIDEQMLTDSGQKELVKMGKASAGQDDNYYSSETKSFAGCTATVALITPTEIYCCNAGDSRTVLSRSKTAVDLSKDHKPDDVEERRRIYAASGFVEDSRVNGMLALSRALGDFEYKSNQLLKPKD